MMSPGFHSAAFLVHLSGLWVAIRRACRHFSFFCVSTQFVMLYLCMCSSASFVLLFIQSSLRNRPLVLLCSLHQHRMKYCCLGRIRHVSCLLLAYFVVTNVRSKALHDTFGVIPSRKFANPCNVAHLFSQWRAELALNVWIHSCFSPSEFMSLSSARLLQAARFFGLPNRRRPSNTIFITANVLAFFASSRPAPQGERQQEERFHRYS